MDCRVGSNLPISCTSHRNTMQLAALISNQWDKSPTFCFSHLNAAVANSLKMEGLQVGS